MGKRGPESLHGLTSSYLDFIVKRRGRQALQTTWDHVRHFSHKSCHLRSENLLNQYINSDTKRGIGGDELDALVPLSKSSQLVIQLFLFTFLFYNINQNI